MVLLSTNKAQNIFIRAAANNQDKLISSKKGIGGPLSINNNSTYDQLNIKWYYDWSIAGWYDFHNNSYEYVPLFSSRFQDFNWCLTQENKNLIDSRINARINEWGFRGKYWLIGNEPEIEGQDLRPGTVDAVKDAVECYGYVAKAIKTRDPEAKLIMLGLADYSHYDFVLSFIQRWKIIWQGTEIANLSQVIKGWHFHDYGSYDRCPTDDSKAQQLNQIINEQMGLIFNQTVPNQEFWVTEMSSICSPGSSSVWCGNPIPDTEENRQKYLKTMECLVNSYENSTLVTHYAWFYHGCNNTSGYCERWWNPTALFLPSEDGQNFVMSYLGNKYKELPTPILPIENCDGNSNIGNQSLSVYTKNVINYSWGYGSPVYFEPAFKGKVDKVEMYAMGNGVLEIKILDPNGLQIGETAQVNINTSTPRWFTLDFTTEGIINPTNDPNKRHTLTFRAKTGTITLYRGNSWAWAYKLWLRPCTGEALPTNTPTPTVSVVSTPTPTPTPVGSCTQFGTSYKDQSWNETYTAQAIATSWWFGDNELRFSPSQKGKVDKVKLFVSWTTSSAVRVKITDLNHNSLTDEKVIYLTGTSSGAWKEFDFATEPLINMGTNYIITFREDSGDAYVHRGSYWKWAYEEWLKPCNL